MIINNGGRKPSTTTEQKMNLADIQRQLNNTTTTKQTLEVMDKMSNERKEIKEWGRTITRLRKSGKFADLIKAEIARSDFKVKEIAAALNTTPASINKWKAGLVFPAVHFLYRLAECLHPEDTLSAYMIYTTKINAERA